MAELFEAPVGPKDLTIRQRNEKRQVIKSWATGSIDLKANVVCKPCNEGWMSDIESQLAKPTMKDMIVKSYPRSLLPGGAHAIAIFAFKTAVIADHMRTSKEGLFFSTSVRRAFMKSRAIPPGVQVWLSSIQSGSEWYGFLRTQYLSTDKGRGKNFRWYVMTYAVGHLVIQTVCSRWIKRGTQRRAPIPAMRQDPMFDPVAIPIWPIKTIPVWPPPQYWTRKTIDDHHDRWANSFPM